MAKVTSNRPRQLRDKTPMPVTKKDGTPRRAPVRRPPIVVFQVLDENGEPMEFAKDRIRAIASTPDADEALTMMESGKYPHAMYIRAPNPKSGSVED